MGCVVDGSYLKYTDTTSSTYLHIPHQPVATSADGLRTVAVASNGQVWVSNDYATTFTPQAGAPSAPWDSVTCNSDFSQLVAVANPGSVWVSTNQGAAVKRKTRSALCA